MDQSNGHTTSIEAQDNAPPRVVKIEDVLDAQITQVLGIVIRGLMVSSPGIPPVLVVHSIARVVGNLLGN